MLHVVAGALLTVAGLSGMDRWVAIYLHQSGYEGLEWLLRGTDWLDAATAKETSKFLLGLLVAGAALALLVPVRTRQIAMVGAITWGLTPVARRRVAPS